MSTKTKSQPPSTAKQLNFGDDDDEEMEEKRPFKLPANRSGGGDDHGSAGGDGNDDGGDDGDDGGDEQDDGEVNQPRHKSFKEPKLKDFKVQPLFDGKEKYPGLGSNFPNWVRTFEDAIEADKAFNGTTWSDEQRFTR
ncbi:hypothetical protein AeMF1_017922 [Aphanomyces euteiches]|nr:hypothetical protein AeMF1_017922 [Aphanomyces euteiches]